MITLLTYAVTKMHFLHFCGISLTKAFPFLSLVVAFRFFCSSNTEHQMNCIWLNQLFNEMSCSLCSSACSSYSPEVNRLNFTVLNLTIADSHTKTEKQVLLPAFFAHRNKTVALKEETIFQYVRINRLLWH